MILVEGADNVGKSWLIAQLLANDPQLRLLRRERFKPSDQRSIGLSYLGALFPNDVHDRARHAVSVADRFFASECIYGELLRGGCRMSDGEHLAIRLALRSYNALVVHCDVPDEVIAKTWASRSQLYEESGLALAGHYRHRLKHIFRGFPVVRYDWTAPDAASVLRRIEAQHAARRSSDLTWWSALPYGIGALNAEIMLLGEATSQRATTPVPFAHGPAGDFLAWAIARAETKAHQSFEETCYVTNADKGCPESAAILRAEIEFVKPKVIVALGKRAQEMLTYLRPSNVLVNAIPHPAFWRCFRWPERETYAQLLLDAVLPTLNETLL